MIKKHYHMLWLCFLLIGAIVGCDSTNGKDASNFQLTIAASPTSLFTGEFSSITATLTNLDTSVATGTSVTGTPTPVSGYPVTFTISQNTSKCSLTIVNGITDSSGKAMAIYQAGSIAGFDSIQASIDKGQFASVTITVIFSPTATPTPTP